MRKVVKAIIYNEGKYLLQLRDNKPSISYPNVWSLFGGEIEKGESKIDALIREIKEEIGWEPDNVNYITKSINYEDKCYIFYYHTHFNANFEKLVLGEGQEMKWFTIEETQKIIHTIDSVKAIKYFDKYHINKIHQYSDDQKIN